MVKRAVARIRSNFLQSVGIGSQEKGRIDEFFDMEFNIWVDMLVQKHGKKIIKEGLDENRDELIRYLKPTKSTADFMKRVQELSDKSDTQEHKKMVPQRYDLYYANLVHGASVRIPMTEIWCAANEMEHSERDTDVFFKVMWKGLRDVLDTSIRAQMPILSSGGRISIQDGGGQGRAAGVAPGAADGANAPQVAMRMGRNVSGEEFVNNLVKSIQRFGLESQSL